MSPGRAFPLSVLALLASTLELAGQTPQLQMRGPSPAVVRLGDQARIELVLEADADVGAVLLPRVQGLAMQAFGPSRQERSFFDGRTTSRTVQLSWIVVLQPQREGKFEVPPLEVPIDGKPVRTAATTLEAIKDTQGDKYGFLSVRVPKTRVYVHEPLRVAFEYGIDAALTPLRGRLPTGEQVFDIELSAPWLDAPDGAVAIEAKKKATTGVETRLLVGNRAALEVVYDSGYVREGRPFHRFTLDRSYLPSRTGTLQLDGPMLRFQVTSGRNQRGRFDPFFEEASGTNYYVYGKPVSVEVLPIPETGRPTPYLGAVGRFTIAAKCEQQRVKLGAPLRVVLTIQGDGNLEFLGVPALDDLHGLHLLGKKEERTAEKVTVTYDLRAIALDLKEIPPLTYSWFDTTPGVERFVTAKTAALPIEVLPLPKGEGLAPEPGEAPRAVTPGVDDIHDIATAAGGEPVPLERAPAFASRLLWLALPWFACFAGAALYGRWSARRSDTVGRRERAARRRAEATLASGDAMAALVGYLADRMHLPEAAVIAPDLGARLARRGLDGTLVERVVRALDAGLAARYGGGGGLAVENARALCDELEAATWKDEAGTRVARSFWPFATLAFLLGGNALPAQGDARLHEGAVAAYRRGDYANAAQAFGRLAAEPGADRRLHYDLGNALYRQGRLPEALLAYERARLALPRDPALRANRALVLRKLDLVSQEGESFAATVAGLREAFTLGERLALAVGTAWVAALLLVVGRRSRVLRIVGLCALVPFLILALEVLWFAAARPLRGIVLAKSAELVAEPRTDLAAMATLRAGVEVELLGRAPGWVRVAVAGKAGYVPEAEVGWIE